MIWLVWNGNGETEADAVRIDAEDCVEAAEEWARRDGAADSINTHLQHDLSLRVRPDGPGEICCVRVWAESEIRYYGQEGW